jgi:hypothetical protein
MAEKKRYAMTSFRLPATIDKLLEDTANKIGQNRTATLVEAIRLLARQEGVPMRTEEELTNV